MGKPKKTINENEFIELIQNSRFFEVFEKVFFKFQEFVLITLTRFKSNVHKNGSILPKKNFFIEVLEEMSREASFFIAGIVALVIIGITVSILIFALVWPKLPSLDLITRYEPVLPMRIYSKDNELIAEFGSERREFTPYSEYPKDLVHALVAAEDKRFFTHSGFDPIGIGRAIYQSIKSGETAKGTSTITQQLARNFYLTQDRTVWRKGLELLLAIKMEQELSKEKILEVYMNQIYLGERSFGFTSAAHAYFSKDVTELTLSESSVLASLPKFPSVNPFTNPARVIQRREYVLKRMLEDGYINNEQYTQAIAEKLPVRSEKKQKINEVDADYVAEMARQYVFNILRNQGYENYEELAYSRGFKVITTINKKRQDYANNALRRGLVNFELSKGFRGDEKKFTKDDLKPSAQENTEQRYEKLLGKLPQSNLIIPAILYEIDEKIAKFYLQGGEKHEIDFSKDKKISKFFDTSAEQKLVVGSVVRFYKSVNKSGKDNTSKASYQITQLPQLTGALIADNPKTGAIEALVGGFSFDLAQFNNVVQAWRQPGSTFKPFIYSAGIDLGINPGRIYNDVPLAIPIQGQGIWRPKNYEESYRGPMSVREALAFSKNSIMVQVMREITVPVAHRYITRFGFDENKIPQVLSVALGSGEVTPWQMMRAYNVFANGGYLILPYVIKEITDVEGKIYYKNHEKSQLTKENLQIDPRNAYIINDMLKDVVNYGTAAKVRSMGRVDLAGKTGTTNDYVDAWFCGYQVTLNTVVWMGYPNPQKIGPRASGGLLALPVWIDFMEKSLKGVRTETMERPKNIGNSYGDLSLREFQGQQIEYNDLDSLLDDVDGEVVDPYSRSAPVDPYEQYNHQNKNQQPQQQNHEYQENPGVRFY